MGFLSDLVDDALELPARIVGGVSSGGAKLLAETLCLPVKLVQAAMDAGCTTEEEIRRFCERNEL